MVSGMLHHLDMHKYMGPDGIQTRVLRELVEMQEEKIMYCPI